MRRMLTILLVQLVLLLLPGCEGSGCGAVVGVLLLLALPAFLWELLRDGGPLVFRTLFGAPGSRKRKMIELRWQLRQDLRMIRAMGLQREEEQALIDGAYARYVQKAEEALR